MSKSLTELAADIVIAQSAHLKMSGDEISQALKKAYGSLAGMKALENPGDAVPQDGPREDAATDKLAVLQQTPLRSIRKNLVTCLECGSEFKMLSRTHLAGHGLTAKEYRKKWGLSAGQALSSQALSEKRRQTAKDLGLGDKLAAARKSGQGAGKKAAPASPAAEPAPEARQKTILRKKAQKEDLGN